MSDKGMYQQFATHKEALANFPKYDKSPEKANMTSRHLTPEMYEKMYKRVTPNGVTVDKVIQPSACTQSNQIMGLLAGDEESYEVFHEIFDAVIDDKHSGFSTTDKQPPPCLDASVLKNGQLDDKYVKSCRVRTGRSVRGLCFPSSISRAERREVERCITEALGELKGDLEGKYYPLGGMTPEDYQQLIDDHFLFQKPTGHLMVNSTAIRDWPDARGIWHNAGKNFLIWINEEDHCRVISMEKGGDMQATFERFGRGLQEIEKSMKSKGREFMWNERLGYLNACPSNIGTGLRCSAHIQLKLLSKRDDFEKICKAMYMQPRGTGGEHTEAVDSVYDVSNSARLKKNEAEFVQQVIDALNVLISMEKKLEAGESIDDLLPEGCK